MRSIHYFLLFAVAAFGSGAAAQPTSGRPDSSRVWIDRDWEFRYILLVESESDFAVSSKIDQSDLASGKPIHEVFIRPYAFFDPTVRIQTLQLAGQPGGDEDSNFAVLAMQFDQAGAVLTPNRAPAKLFAKLNRIEGIVLAPGNAPTDFQIDVARFYVGADSGANATPALCSSNDARERYKPRAKFDFRLGRFGCREWGHYLQNPKYPYIDVTSYEPKKAEFLEYWEFDPKTGKDELRETDARIAPFIGWGRFDTPPKPVIGQHVGKWFCLHECPDGEAPGLIPDIRAWAAKRGWPVPQRPKRMPLFPDPPRRAGTFID